MESGATLCAGAQFVVCVKREDKVLDRASVVFSRAFYHSLLTGHGSVLALCAFRIACLVTIDLHFLFLCCLSTTFLLHPSLLWLWDSVCESFQSARGRVRVEADLPPTEHEKFILLTTPFGTPTELGTVPAIEIVYRLAYSLSCIW